MNRKFVLIILTILLNKIASSQIGTTVFGQDLCNPASVIIRNKVKTQYIYFANPDSVSVSNDKLLNATTDRLYEVYHFDILGRRISIDHLNGLRSTTEKLVYANDSFELVKIQRFNKNGDLIDEQVSKDPKGLGATSSPLPYKRVYAPVLNQKGLYSLFLIAEDDAGKFVKQVVKFEYEYY